MKRSRKASPSPRPRPVIEVDTLESRILFGFFSYDPIDEAPNPQLPTCPGDGLGPGPGIGPRGGTSGSGPGGTHGGSGPGGHGGNPNSRSAASPFPVRYSDGFPEVSSED